MFACLFPSDITHGDFQLLLSRKLTAVLQENQPVKILAVLSSSTRVFAIVVHEVIVDSHDHALLLKRFVDDSRVFLSSDTQVASGIAVGLRAEHWPQFPAALI